jgi:hypothetical protein
MGRSCDISLLPRQTLHRSCPSSTEQDSVTQEEDVPGQTQSLHQSSNLPFKSDNIDNKDWSSGNLTRACSSTHKLNDRAI